MKNFNTGEELRQALLEFKPWHNENWILQRHGFKTPAEMRREQLQALDLAV